MVDALVRSSVGALFPLFARRAGPRAVLAAAALAVPAAVPTNWTAFAGLGAALAAFLVPRPRSDVAALSAVGLAQAVVRLDGDPFSVPTLVASAGAGLLAFAGTTRMRRPQRRRIVRSALALAAVGFVLSTAWVVAALTARPALVSAAEAGQSALASARSGDVVAATAGFRTAEEQFSRAVDDVGAWWARPALLLPVVGPNARALLASAEEGERLARTALSTVATADPNVVRLDAGRVPIDRLRALEPPLRRSVGALADAGRRLRGASSAWVVPPLDARVVEFTQRVDRARRDATVALDAVRLVPEMVGGDGPRRYFVAMQTPSELRATGGLIGNYGILEARDGHLTLTKVGRSSDLNTGGEGNRRLTGPPDYLARYGSFAPQSEWRNVNMSPDFPTVADVIAQLYPQSGGDAIDGVLAVDPIGLSSLLAVVGPVTVPGLDEPLTVENAARTLLFDQYVLFGDNPERIEFLGTAAASIWDRFTAGVLPPPAELARVLGPVARGRHLLVTSRHPEEQRFLARLGVDGSFPAVRGDSLALVTQNASGNKIDWFLRREVSYDVAVDPADSRVSATVEIRLTNDAPSLGLPDIVILGTLGATQRGENKMYLSLYTPWGLTAATLDGRRIEMESRRELGRSAYSTFLVVPPGGTSTLRLRLSGRLPTLDGYILDVTRQVTVNPDRFSATVTVPPGWGLSGVGTRRETPRRATTDVVMHEDLDVDLKVTRRRGNVARLLGAKGRPSAQVSTLHAGDSYRIADRPPRRAMITAAAPAASIVPAAKTSTIVRDEPVRARSP